MTNQTYQITLRHDAYGPAVLKVDAPSDEKAIVIAGMHQLKSGHGWTVSVDCGDRHIASRERSFGRWNRS